MTLAVAGMVALPAAPSAAHEQPTTTAATAAHPAEKRAGGKVLIVCANPNAMPRTGRARDGSPQGVDAGVAQQVAGKLRREIGFHWCGNSCHWRCLREGRCDVVIGQPHGSLQSNDVAWSKPYAGSVFGLVAPSDAKNIASLDDLRGKRVGVVAGTVAVSAKEHQVVRAKTRDELLEQFQALDLDAALVDADFAAWYLHEHPDLPLRLVPAYLPRERWNLAFAVRSNEPELLRAINRALDEVSQSQRFREAFTHIGLTCQPPFTNVDRDRVAYDAWKRIRERGELVVSMDPANLPYSSADEQQPGIDVELARALAAELRLSLRIAWIDVHRETALGELLDGECDLALGSPIDAGAVDDEMPLAGKVLYSRPYYGSGYLLVVRKDGPRVGSLEELQGPLSRRLGTEAGAIADYRLRQRGYQRRLFRNQLAVLKALDDASIDYAYLWANVGWTLHTTPEFELEVVPDFVPPDHWNIAVAMRRGDDELKRQVDAALDKLMAEGTVAQALARYHVPYFPPFAEANDAKSSRRGVIKHPVARRGPEPQMHRRQTSKQPYRALDRIRAAGELVVGLDQQNLPFSTAHPEPAGLDYEFAALLAEQLGVSLRVYWAYSSHDSYPSKLAAKKLCDCIVGVTPDDRFSGRVLFSNPYYMSGYELVVRAADAGELDDGALLGAERGIAARGLDGRSVQSYPSLEAVLEAVASGQVAAGYAIVARGHWLAEQNWPGMLRFAGPLDSRDRLPICVAVRKSDSDLKEAIDRSLAELAESGRLAEVFARWQIPYVPPGGGGARSE